MKGNQYNQESPITIENLSQFSSEIELKYRNDESSIKEHKLKSRYFIPEKEEIYKIKCRNCGVYGHMKRECPSESNKRNCDFCG